MNGETFLAELGASLHGPRRSRRRLIEELSAHIEDATIAEVRFRRLNRREAEQTVLDRLGCAETIAGRWNAHQREVRATKHRRLAVSAVSLAAAAALAVTQYAAGKPAAPASNMSGQNRCLKPTSPDAQAQPPTSSGTGTRSNARCH
jgi:hypothetical protein